MMLQLFNRLEETQFPQSALPERSPEKLSRAVLKFGGSVLRDHHDLARVAGEIYRQSLRYRQLFVVVSAFDGQTDQLLERFQLISGKSDCEGCADLVSLGEELTVTQLRAACSRIGLNAIVMRPEQWAIRAEGPNNEANPRSVDPIPAHIPSESIVIVPGFVALNDAGERVLLGRGGSDFSALFLGGELNADLVRLYKDVDGVYDHDPATGATDLHRFDQVDWDQCLEIARPLLQPDAIRYAKSKSLSIEVGVIGSLNPTLVTHSAKRAKDLVPKRPLQVGIAGFGVVGQALFLRLIQEPDFKVVAVLVRDVTKKRSIYPPFALTDDLELFRSAEFDVLIDVTCGEEAGFPLTCHQLEQGRAVISANKTVIEPWFEELDRLKRQSAGYLGLSACVGGGTPILELIDRITEGRKIEKVTAILNGTVNFLLDQLAQGKSFDSALTQAQVAGFAEEDPSQDLSGNDAEIKLRLIARHAFQSSSRDILIRKSKLTPARIAKISASGERWVQLATLERAKNCALGSIGFARASSVSRLPGLPAERNFARVTLSDGREFEVVGRGAGGAPTAEAIMTDLYAFRQKQDGRLHAGEPLVKGRAES